MSGGSYNYLCLKDADQIREREEELQWMADRLSELGYAQDAAQETMEVLLTIRAFETRMQARIDRLRGIWRAVEWWDSGDSGEDSLEHELKVYRGEDTDVG